MNLLYQRTPNSLGQMFYKVWQKRYLICELSTIDNYKISDSIQNCKTTNIVQKGLSLNNFRNKGHRMI